MGQMFYLERPRLGARLEYAFRDSSQTTPTRQQRGTSHVYTEGLTVASRGFIYHPALLVFDLNFDPKWEQQREKYEPGQDNAKQSFALDYNFDGTLLQNRPLSLQLLTRQRTSTTSSNLNPTTTSENSLYGAALVYKSKEFPTRLSYMNSEQKQQGFYASAQTSESLRLVSSHRAERHQTNLNADYEKRQRDTRGLSRLTENASFRVNNALDVSADRRIRLASNISTRWTESQAITATNLDIGEFLDWRHTDLDQRLQINSNYSARYSANRRQGELSEDIPLAAKLSISHKLYDNLISSLDGDIGHHKFEGGREQKYGGRVHFDYYRPIPIGALSLNLGQSYRVNDRTVTDTKDVEVFDEKLILSDLSVILLTNRNVVRETIRVFNADKSVEYVRDLDFTVIPIGDFTRIARVMLGGGIADNDTVLVDYNFHPDPSAKLGTTSRTFGAGLYLWSALNLRYRLTRTEGKLLDGTPPDHLADDTTQSISAQLRYRWSDTLLTYDDEKRAAGNSLRRWQARQNFYWRPRPDLALTAGGSYSETEMLESNSNSQAYRVNASGQWQPTPNQKWRLETFQNIITSNRPDRIESTGLGIFYLLRYGLWNLEATYRHLIDKQPLVNQERALDTVNLTLRRAVF